MSKSYWKKFKEAKKVQQVRAALGERNGWFCNYCGLAIHATSGNTATLDHIIVKSKGGKTNTENCVLACEDCNRARSHMTLAAFQNWITRLKEHSK